MLLDVFVHLRFCLQLRFSTTSSLMDPLQPVAQCNTSPREKLDGRKTPAFSSLYEALSSDAPFAPRPPSLSRASTDPRACRERRRGGAQGREEAREEEDGAVAEAHSRRAEFSDSGKKTESHRSPPHVESEDVSPSDPMGGGVPAHVAFWEEIENSLPEYVAGTYYTSDHIVWDIPPPPFEATFHGSTKVA